MGRTYLFECPKCSYRAKVSGGADRGYNLSIQTILCRDCRQLYDAVLWMRTTATRGIASHRPFGLPNWRGHKSEPVSSTPPTFSAALNRLQISGGKPTHWIQFKLRCPVSPFHRVQTWKTPGRCPRCGVYLEKIGRPFRIWD